MLHGGAREHCTGEQAQTAPSMYALLLVFVVMNCMFFVARYTSRAFERCVRRSYWYMYKKKPRHSGGEGGGGGMPKMLVRQRLTYREMLCDYMTALESDAYAKTQWEVILWDWYCNNVSEENRRRATEDTLPAWAEWCDAVYHNFYIYNAALLCVFFAVSLLSASLWMPLLGIDGGGAARTQYNASETRRLAISALVNQTLYACDSAQAGDYCYLEEADVNYAVLLRSATMTTTHDSTPTTAALQRDAVWHDRRGVRNRYVQTALHGVRWISDWTLRYTLEHVQRDEAQRGLHDAPCVCAAFLGLRDNVSLIYDAGVWHVLWHPTIQRVNALASEVRSTVRYHYNSILFPVHQRLQQQQQQQGDGDDVVHYDAFMVEYDAEDEPQDDNGALHVMSYQVRALEQQPLLFSRAAAPVRRARLQLRGNEAICYVYCEKLKEKEAAAVNK